MKDIYRNIGIGAGVATALVTNTASAGGGESIGGHPIRSVDTPRTLNTAEAATFVSRLRLVAENTRQATQDLINASLVKAKGITVYQEPLTAFPPDQINYLVGTDHPWDMGINFDVGRGGVLQGRASVVYDEENKPDLIKLSITVNTPRGNLAFLQNDVPDITALTIPQDNGVDIIPTANFKKIGELVANIPPHAQWGDVKRYPALEMPHYMPAQYQVARWTDENGALREVSVSTHEIVISSYPKGAPQV